MLNTSVKRCISRISKIALDQRGVSAIEFALLAPVMIALYLGCAQISQGVTADRKVSLVSAALANLTAQATTLSTSDMTNILDASSAIISPFSAANLTMTVSCLKIDANKNVTVQWSVTRGGTANSGSMTIPSALAVANTQLILAQASYNYVPIIGTALASNILLSDKMYMSPRITAPTYGNTTCT
jgi:Flp pilus assembly protein TadG